MGTRPNRARIMVICLVPALLFGVALTMTGRLPRLPEAVPAVTEPPAITLPTAPVVVSGESPYADCRLGGDGTRYVNGEVETWVAIDPVALKQGKVHLLGTWMADRWSNGGGSGLVTASSFDGGATWNITPMAFNGCATRGLLPHGRASDPWVAFGPDGRAYAAALIIDITRGDFAVGAAASGDGGRTWEHYQVLQQESWPKGAGVDKEAVTADPVRPGTAYLVWTRNDHVSSPPARGSVLLSRTTDGGLTWSAPRVIWQAEDRNHAVGAVIWADPRDGTLYHIFRWFRWPTESNNQYITDVGFQRSTDGGDTWSEAAVIAPITSAEVRYPDLADAVRTGGSLPLAAVDPQSGRIYVVWEDARWSEPRVEVALAYSDDRGETWSEPVRVNRATDLAAFRPTVAVNSKGQMGISYYQFLRGEGAAATEFRLAVYDPGTEGLGDPRDFPVDGPFDISQAPRAPGPFLGDYQGLIAVDDWFHMFYVVAGMDSANPSDVRAVGLRPGDR